MAWPPEAGRVKRRTGASRTRQTIGPIRSSAKYLIPRRSIATRSTACVRGRTNGGLSDDGVARHGGDRTRGKRRTRRSIAKQRTARRSSARRMTAARGARITRDGVSPSRTITRPRDGPATTAIRAGAAPVVPVPTRRIATCATACVRGRANGRDTRRMTQRRWGREARRRSNAREATHQTLDCHTDDCHASRPSVADFMLLLQLSPWSQTELWPQTELCHTLDCLPKRKEERTRHGRSGSGQRVSQRHAR